MIRLFTEQPLAAGGLLALEGDELHYLSHVRRAAPGDAIELCAASGVRFSAKVTRIDKRQALLQVGSELSMRRTVWPVRVCVAVPKRHLLDDVVRQVSELGVERLSPLATRRSVMLPGQAKLERWRRIADESLRQCGRSAPLIVEELRPWADALADLPTPGQAFLLDPDLGGEPAGVLLGTRTHVPLTFFVGPEGGLDADELTLATKQGVRRVRLGASILRVETAAVTAALLGLTLVGAYDAYGEDHF